MCQIQEKHYDAMDDFEMRDNVGNRARVLQDLYRAADSGVKKGPFSPFDVL
jgi:hypothetical protein